MTTLLEAVTAAVHGDERQMLREDARQVILAARECLNGGHAAIYASLHVPAVEAVIANLLPVCTGASGNPQWLWLWSTTPALSSAAPI
ncbi:hypothetical protein [Streptomyces decoyicus]